jgi:uncharacterized RDD family membrane protein YckC
MTIDPQQGTPENPFASPTPGQAPAYPQGPADPHAPTYPQGPAYPNAPAYSAQPGYAPGYGAAPAWGAPTWGAAPAWGAPLPPLASWGERLGASVIDSLMAGVPLMIGYGVSVATIFWSAAASSSSGATGTTGTTGTTGILVVGFLALGLGWLADVGIIVWNRVLRQGRTGQSVGKKILGIRLLSEDHLQPIGPGMAFVRDVVHAVDGIFYVGYLRPLWDVKRQTFADTIIKTLVVKG